MSTWWTYSAERCFSVMTILKYTRPIGLHKDTNISIESGINNFSLVGLNRKLDFVL